MHSDNDRLFHVGTVSSVSWLSSHFHYSSLCHLPTWFIRTEPVSDSNATLFLCAAMEINACIFVIRDRHTSLSIVNWTTTITLRIPPIINRIPLHCIPPTARYIFMKVMTSFHFPAISLHCKTKPIALPDSNNATFVQHSHHTHLIRRFKKVVCLSSSIIYVRDSLS